MENLDLIIMTTVVVVVFAIFYISLLWGFGSDDGIKSSEPKNNK